MNKRRALQPFLGTVSPVHLQDTHTGTGVQVNELIRANSKACQESDNILNI